MRNLSSSSDLSFYSPRFLSLSFSSCICCHSLSCSWLNSYSVLLRISSINLCFLTIWSSSSYLSLLCSSICIIYSSLSSSCSRSLCSKRALSATSCICLACWVIVCLISSLLSLYSSSSARHLSCNILSLCASSLYLDSISVFSFLNASSDCCFCNNSSSFWFALNSIFAMFSSCNRDSKSYFACLDFYMNSSSVTRASCLLRSSCLNRAYSMHSSIFLMCSSLARRVISSSRMRSCSIASCSSCIFRFRSSSATPAASCCRRMRSSLARTC